MVVTNSDVFRFTFYWTLILYTPVFLLCGAYAFWNYTFPPTSARSGVRHPKEESLYEMTSPIPLYPSTSRYTGSNLPPPSKLPKINERRSRVAFATIIFVLFVALSVAGSVLGSAVLGFIMFGLFKAAHFHMSTVWPSIIEII
ncbi:hypothetical protein D9611_012741 [Ephemerocybe angulata]|uniref:Uncharacterized protein n=1 Tax=Ephemerocybe angulata TaxID=980116 RepID=A0A8H5CBB3_9AGAR|nr:hypothetical protein D9611_012741 [Tulosesus angulatus]